jgi:surface carbohydrate biosynthesis protein
LLGLLLVACKLCQQDIICHLVLINTVSKREIWSLAPDFVLLHNLRQSQYNFVKQLVRAKIPFGLLDNEGGVWAEPEAYREMLFTDRELLHKAECICAWSPALAAYLISHGSFLDKQLRLTGSPNFDFYIQPWRRLFGPRKGDPRSVRLLINTNFTEVNHKTNGDKQAFWDLGGIASWTPERIQELVTLQKEGMAGMIGLARDLARDYPQCQIVLRPHPAEGSGVYERSLAGIPNVEINTSGPIHVQLACAAAVIQRSCTTAFEANFAGVPALSPQWVPVSPVVPSAEQVSVPCASYADLKSHLDAIISGTFRTPKTIAANMERMVAEWFFRVDGNSHERVVSAILGCLQGSRTVDYEQCLKFSHGLHGGSRRSLDGWSRWLRYRLGLPPNWSFRSMRQVNPADRLDGFDREAIARDVDQICDLLRSREANARSVEVNQSRSLAGNDALSSLTLSAVPDRR